MSFVRLARFWTRVVVGANSALSLGMLLGVSALTSAPVLCLPRAHAQVAPPSAPAPVPTSPEPGPQPARPPLAAPAAPLIPQPEAPLGATSIAPAAPAPASRGASPSVYSTYPQGSASAPPYAPTQPTQPYYGQTANMPGYPQPLSYQRPLSRPPGPGHHEHEGFYLRMSAGGGAAGMSYRERFDGVHTANVRTRGLAGSLELAVGGSVAPNLMVHGNLGFVGINARRSIDDVRDDSYDSIGTKFWLLGAGITWYVMPANLYLTLVLGTGGMFEQRDYGGVGKTQEQLHSTPGFASSLAIGKEWWVGGRGDWGIGASITGALYAAPIDISGVRSTAVGNSISLAFSATLN